MVCNSYVTQTLWGSPRPLPCGTRSGYILRHGQPYRTLRTSRDERWLGSCQWGHSARGPLHRDGNLRSQADVPTPDGPDLAWKGLRRPLGGRRGRKGALVAPARPDSAMAGPKRSRPFYFHLCQNANWGQTPFAEMGSDSISGNGV